MIYFTEYDQFIAFYEKLQKVLPVQDISPDLVTAKIITPREQHEIVRYTRDDDKAIFVLNKISSSLKSGYPKDFYKLLNIMKNHSTEVVSDLANQLQINSK